MPCFWISWIISVLNEERASPTEGSSKSSLGVHFESSPHSSICCSPLKELQHLISTVLLNVRAWEDFRLLDFHQYLLWRKHPFGFLQNSQSLRKPWCPWYLRKPQLWVFWAGTFWISLRNSIFPALINQSRTALIVFPFHWHWWENNFALVDFKVDVPTAERCYNGRKD